MVYYLITELLLSSFIRYKSFLYSIKPFRDNSFCLNASRFEGVFDLVLFTSCLILGLSLLECDLDFLNVLSIYYVEIFISFTENQKEIF